LVTDDEGAPVGGVPVQLLDPAGSPVATATTGPKGRVAWTWLATGPGKWRVQGNVVAADPAVTGSADVRVLRGTTGLSAPARTRARSEAAVTVPVSVSWEQTGRILSGRDVLVQRRRGSGRWVAVDTVRTGKTGVARVRLSSWRQATFRVRATATSVYKASPSSVVQLSTTPRGRVVRRLRGKPEPRRGPSGPGVAPVGAGANSHVARIPDAVWRRMVGISWQPGCPVGRDRLRLVSVNYWGFDGYRRRGRLVVHEGIAPATARAFTRLYNAGYPIRQMRLVDAYGRSRYRGANDYASMAADNTSGFNCRYVVGAEPRRILSPHAYGVAIDINPWENPYNDGRRVHPSRAWISRTLKHPAILRSGSPGVNAMRAEGFFWGGAWARFDYHHFERWSGARSTTLQAAQQQLEAFRLDTERAGRAAAG
jgi:hypothetical protein